MAGGDERRWLTGRRVACLGALALAAGGFVLLATHDGVSLGGDDSVYSGTARSVAAGHGLDVPIHYYPLGNVSIGTPPAGSSAPRPTPLVVYAPLEPVMLAVGGQHPVGTARVEDALFLMLTVLLAGLLVLCVTGELWLAAEAQLVLGLVLAPAVASDGTEASALFFAMVGLAAVLRYRERPGARWLALGSAAFGLALVTRFAAGGLVIWGVLALRKRPRAAVALFVASCLPVIGWLVYERVSGRSTGHEIGFHVVKTTVRSGLHTIAFWLLPTNISTAGAVLGTLVVAGVVVLVLRRGVGTVPGVLVLYAVVQIVVLEVAITFFDAGVNLEPREFIPIFLAVVLALACGVARTRTVMMVTALLVVGCALRFGIDTATTPPGGYTMPMWQKSAILADVEALPRSAVIYSDAPDWIYLLAGRATSSIPERVDFSTLKENPRFGAKMDGIRRTLSRREGYVVYIRTLGREAFLPDEATLRRLLGLHLVSNSRYGAIYTIRSD